MFNLDHLFSKNEVTIHLIITYNKKKMIYRFKSVGLS